MAKGFWVQGILSAVLALALAGSGAGQGVDWSAWEELPVFHNGRVMPLVSFAEEMAELICGRANPVLEPDGLVAASGVLFPDNKPRRFTASELLFSWLVAPDMWQSVPFLLAAREELRSLLGVPIRGPGGARLRYVSPQAVRQSARFRAELQQISQKLRKAEEQGTKPQLTPLEDSCQRLNRALQLFEMLSFRSSPSAELPESFWQAMVAASEAFREGRAALIELQRFQNVVPESLSPSDLATRLSGIRTLFHQVMEIGNGRESSFGAADSLVAQLRQASQEVRLAASTLRNNIFAASPPAGLEAQQWQEFRSAANRLATAAARMSQELRAAHLSLFEAPYALRVVPALEPDFLEADRRSAEEPHVWIALGTLLDGSPQLLGPMPEAELRSVRSAFAKAATAYRQGAMWQDPAEFSRCLRELSQALRALGTSVNNIREGLPVAHRDVELERATRYPEPRDLLAEIRYHRLKPFLWAWVTSGLALIGFGLSFGAIRRPAFALGVLALVASAGFSAYGLALRAQVTGFTPVTNMFETVVFVAMVTALLGLWIVAWPWFGPAVTRAWRLTALPGTFEATPLSESDLAFAPETTWRRAGWALGAVRLILGVLTIAVLLNIRSGAKGGQPVFSLVPGTEPGTLTLNDWVVWLVGLIVLISAAWFVPRVVLTLLVAPVIVPTTVRQSSCGEIWREVLNRRSLAAISAAVTLVAALVAYMAPLSGKRIAPLMPVLRDNFWLTLHVLTITASYGAGALVWGLANLSLAHFLFGRYRLAPPQPAGQTPAPGLPLRKQPPQACVSLATYMYRGMQVAVVLLAAGTIFGGLWADVSWGRFWGWDSKEVWALIALLVYLGVLHGRLVGMLNEFGLAVGAIFGATAIIVAWYGVNFVFGSGLHSYGEGTGGGGYVAMALVLNWLFVGAAWLRYNAEMVALGTPPPETAPTGKAETQPAAASQL